MKLRLQSSRARDLAKGLEPKSEDVLGRGSPISFTRGEGEPILVEVERTLEIDIARGALGVDDGTSEAVCDARKTIGWEDNAHPRAETKSHIDRSTHGAVKRRPTWLVTPQKRHVLQEPHDMQAARSTARWA